MISAPGFGVVLEYVARHDARRHVPRASVAAVVANDEVGGVRQVRATVELDRVEQLDDPDLARLVVHQPADLLDQLLLERTRLVARLDDAFLLTAGDVEEEPGEAQRVGLGLRPVDVA